MSWLTALRDRLRSHTNAERRTVDGLAWRGQPLLDYARQPEEGWQAMLDHATAAGERLSSLRLHWVAGDPWQPVNRWFLFQLQPWAHVSEAIHAELDGPHPRTDARLEYIPRVIDGKVEHRPAIRGGPCRIVDRTQWTLHRQILRETGVKVFPRYWWVVQGDAGGHPFMVSLEEQKLRRELGLTPDVPSAGDLPYAPFDRRVLTALERYDLFRYANRLDNGDLTTRAARVQITRLNDQEREAHRLLWQKWGDVMGEIGDGLAHAARQDGVHYHRWTRPGERAPVIDHDAEAEAFINDVSLRAS